MLSTLPSTGAAFAGALQRYLSETLHLEINVSDFVAVPRLQAFLERRYRLYEAHIARRHCVFAVTREDISTPGDIAKHIANIRSAVEALVVLATPSLSSHNRQRLLKYGVAFVVPGNQLYIPELAMDLRENFRAPKEAETDGLAPAAQAVLFHHLLGRSEGVLIPSRVARELGYSAMSIGRAFDDLVSTGLAETAKHGKERHLRFTGDRRTLFDAARGYMRSPVRGVKFLQGTPDSALMISGESALAELTDLAPPRIATRAITASDWKVIARDHGLVETDRFGADYAIETWSYDPARLSASPVVDRLSLHAQFKDHHDERVAAAARQLLEGVQW